MVVNIATGGELSDRAMEGLDALPVMELYGPMNVLLSCDYEGRNYPLATITSLALVVRKRCVLRQ